MHGNSWDRISIARRPDLSSDQLAALAADFFPNVRRALAERGDLPLDLIELLAGDSDAVVREGIALRDDLPTEILLRLANDTRWFVRRAIALNPEIDDHFEVACRLATDPEPEVGYPIRQRDYARRVAAEKEEAE